MTASDGSDIQTLFDQVRSGARVALAQAITLVESQRPEDLPDQAKLVGLCRHEDSISVRLAVTGPPGAGKSTLIERLGLHLIEEGHRVAVLAIDPSSEKSGGSILGDKTRMEKLSVAENAFIRPSPSAGHSGGVSEHTRESISLCEAARYNVILIETMGVGQAEYRVQKMVDLLLLVTIPGAGDGLQGIKRGIMEIADMVIVNKADADNIGAARRTAAELKAACRLAAPGENRRIVLTASAKTGEGIPKIWEAVSDLISHRKKQGSFSKQRAQQDKAWFDDVVESQLKRRLESAERLEIARDRLTSLVVSGELDPVSAAGLYVDAVLRPPFQ